ncbi:MAG TPA: hypothetical protein VHU15_14450 [Stellaceae bacterium]|jgi:hypothetical protein|nr:hypothetical protein [Stellaceae bacterium]
MQIGRYRIDPVFGTITPQLRGELVQFWLDEGALPDANAAWARTDEVVCIARDPARAIASVNTVYLAPLQGPDDLHYFYRMFTRPQDRLLELTTGMVRVCRESLEASRLRDPRARGVVIVAENPKLQGPAGHRLLSSKGWVHLGKNPRGFDVWRKLFPGAAAPVEPV